MTNKQLTMRSNEFDHTIISEAWLFAWCISNDGVQFTECFNLMLCVATGLHYKEMESNTIRTLQNYELLCW